MRYFEYPQNGIGRHEFFVAYDGANHAVKYTAVEMEPVVRMIGILCHCLRMILNLTRRHSVRPSALFVTT